jgi:predicted dehydrogenase
MTIKRPRLGFLGTGWIGTSRMQAVLDHGLAEVCGICDCSPEASSKAARLAPSAKACTSLEALLALELDGLVIATPSAQHAREACFALEQKVSVFCQKPLARSKLETVEVVECARKANRLLAVDFSYRHTAALSKLKQLLSRGELGTLYHARFVFHNAYGPDKAWYRDRALAGGGCATDLGIHWIDAALWLLDDPLITRVSSQLFAGGQRLTQPLQQSEDHAIAQLETADGCLVEIACSWNMHAGRDAVIEVELNGTRGGATMRNVDGSFYDFSAQQWRGTQTVPLVEPPDAWGGRALVSFVERLADSSDFDPAASSLIKVAELLERIYLA